MCIILSFIIPFLNNEANFALHIIFMHVYINLWDNLHNYVFDLWLIFPLSILTLRYDFAIAINAQSIVQCTEVIVLCDK